MARKANPQRAESLKRYLDKKGKITIEELANLAGVPKKTISKWKCEDKWEEVLKQQPKKKGGQLGNKNAAGKNTKKERQPECGNAWRVCASRVCRCARSHGRGYQEFIRWKHGAFAG